MIEEKLTDIQLAPTSSRDALRGGVDQVVVCSNDSDAEPAFTTFGVMRRRCRAVLPTSASRRRRTGSAHHILDGELAASQLPAHGRPRKSLQASRGTGSHPSRSPGACARGG